MTAAKTRPDQLFPIIRHIDDVLPAIAGMKEFFVAQRSGYMAIDYGYRGEDTFGKLPGATPEEQQVFRLRRECRGIKFDAKSGEIICRPYHKFFNLGELGEFQPQDVDWRVDHHVLDKLDGSMVAPARVDGAIRYMTRISDREVAAQAAAFAHSHPNINYDRFAGGLLDEGITPIFEWCSRQQRIVIDYPEDRLVLTGLRRMFDGCYLAYEEMAEIASLHAIPCVAAWRQSVTSTSSFVAHARGITDAEGFVVRFTDGQMIKLKADAYIARHAALADLTSERKILKLVLAGLDDDFVQLLDDSRRKRLEEYAGAVRSALKERAVLLEQTVTRGWERVSGDRKRFALEITSALPPILQGGAFSVLDGRPAYGVLVQLLDKHSNRAGDLDRAAFLLGGLRWEPVAMKIDA